MGETAETDLNVRHTFTYPGGIHAPGQTETIVDALVTEVSKLAQMQEVSSGEHLLAAFLHQNRTASHAHVLWLIYSQKVRKQQKRTITWDLIVADNSLVVRRSPVGDEFTQMVMEW